MTMERLCQYKPCGKPLPKGAQGQRKYHLECAKAISKDKGSTYQLAYRDRKLAARIDAMTDEEWQAFVISKHVVSATSERRALLAAMSPEERRVDKVTRQQRDLAARRARGVACFTGVCDNMAEIGVDSPEPVCMPCYKHYGRYGRYSRGQTGDTPCVHCGDMLPRGASRHTKYHEECAAIFRKVRSRQWFANLSGAKLEAYRKKNRTKQRNRWFAKPAAERKAYTLAKLTPERRTQMRKSEQALHEKRRALKVPCSVDGCPRLAVMNMEGFSVCRMCYNQKQATGSYVRQRRMVASGR